MTRLRRQKACANLDTRYVPKPWTACLIWFKAKVFRQPTNGQLGAVAVPNVGPPQQGFLAAPGL